MDRVYDKEKSSRKSRNEGRDSVKDHHHRVSHRENNRDHRDYRHQSSRDDGRSRESEELHHDDKYRKMKRHHRSKEKDYLYDYEDEEPQKDRSVEPKNGREGSREREGEREREKVYRERSHEPRDKREGSRDRRISREESVERGLHKRKDRADSEDRLEKSEKRRKEEKREKRRFEDKVMEDSRDLNGTIKEDRRKEHELENRGKDERNPVENVESSNNGRRERRRFGDRAKMEDRINEKDEGYLGLDMKSEKKELVDEQVEDTSLKTGNSNWSSSSNDGAASERLSMKANTVSKHTWEPGHPPPTKMEQQLQLLA